jgi:type I restriction enzyme M protein
MMKTRNKQQKARTVYRKQSVKKSMVKEQQLLYSESSLLPDALPRFQELKPSLNLSAVFDECHNNIYANEGMLKDKIFHEMVKLLVMKLYDEQHHAHGGLQFGITSNEHRSILSHAASSFEPRLNRLFKIVRTEHPDFFTDDNLKLKPLTLAFVVGRLQHISLLRTPGDVKGEAFQSFVYRHQRGDRGEYFTPHPIVRLAVEIVAPMPNETIIDPACGSGGFLIQALSYLSQNHRQFDKSSYIKEHLRGIEFNPDVALSASIRLAFEGGNGTEILCANALLEHEHLTGAVDVVLTNPPFGSKGKVEDQRILKSYLLARRWNKTTSNGWEATNQVLAGQSPEILFIEKCLRLLRPGGRMAIVLPDGLLQNISNSHIRYWIRSVAKVLGVVSIPQEAFIPYGTGIKTSLLLLQKLPSEAEDVFMARIHNIGYDVKGQPVYKRDNNGRSVRSASGTQVLDDDTGAISQAYNSFKTAKAAPTTDLFFTLKAAQMNSRLDVEHYLPRDQRLIEQLRSEGAKPLGAIADILGESDDFRLAADAEIKYIAISDVDSRSMQVVCPQIIKAHEAPSRATYRVQAGDIITAVSGASTGTLKQATALISDEEDGAICSNGFAVLRNVHGVEPLFLLAYMRTEFFLRQVRRMMTGHAIPTISIEDLSKVLVLIPTLAEQNRIAQSIAESMAMRKEAVKAGERIVSEVGELVGAHS